MKPRFASLERALEHLSRGGIVIVSDSLARENEGDLLAAAELTTDETIHFMTTYARGHLCQPVTAKTAERLDLHPLVPQNGPNVPCFAMPVDQLECGTGISPLERAVTVRAIANPSSRACDFRRPGHVFPLIARDGGVLARPGHTESATDLMTLAGLSPSGVLCEICSRDGKEMARLPELNQLAAEHDLPIVAIDTLIDYRREHAPFLQADPAFELVEELAALEVQPREQKPTR